MPGFIAFGVFSLPAGWLADRWSREGMIAIFFVGIGAASIVTSLAETPGQMALGLFAVGVFAAIYHPVGLALVVEHAKKTGAAIAANGVWGNLGVGSAALITGFMIDNGGWRSAFVVPGVLSILCGAGYAALTWDRIVAHSAAKPRSTAAAAPAAAMSAADRRFLVRFMTVVFFTTAVSGIIFQSTSFALPKVFEERLTGIAGSATLIGWLAFLVFAIASMAQLVVGQLLDRLGPRTVFMGVATIQVVFFSLMPGLADWPALLVAIAFMLGAFGQIPINDYMIGRMAKSELRASIYGARYVVAFAVLAAALPLIAWVHKTWGFDTLFRILAGAAAVILLAVMALPGRLPDAAPPARAAAAE
jgi:MFS family permease